MRLKQRTTVDELFLTVEDFARRNDSLRVEYKGQEGTLIEGSEESFREIVDAIEDQRSELWDEMSDGVSNSKATELDDKRKDLRNSRNRLQSALSNPDHKWRDN